MRSGTTRGRSGRGAAALVAGLAAFAIAAAAEAQGRDFDAVEIKTHAVAGAVYMLEGAGGNIGVSTGPDGVFMVDDQYAPLTDKIVAAVAAITDGEIRFLINTHIHPDHVGGNENLGRAGAVIVGHESIRRRLAEGVFGRPPVEAAGLPAITFADGVTFHLNGEDVRAWKLPDAHTDGDTLIHFTGSDVIHAGDVFRTTAYPVIDTRHGGTYRGTLEALDVIIRTAGPDTRIIPGHGVVTGRAAVAEFRDMVATIGDRVAALIADGATLDAVLAARVTADYDERWDYRPGFFITKDDLIATIYRELSAEG